MSVFLRIGIADREHQTDNHIGIGVRRFWRIRTEFSVVASGSIHAHSVLHFS
jgi:hypothetical protein